MNNISRVTRSKEKARQVYDGLSRWYDLFTASEKKFADFGLKALNVQSGERILEIGFGTGYALARLARAAQPATVCGIDLSPQMREIAAKKLRRAGLDANLQTGDAANLPYANGHFDAIFIAFTLELFDTPEIPRVLRECLRVLKIGGRLSMVALEKRDCRAVRIYEWFHRALPNAVDCRPIHAAQSLREAGFEIAGEQIRSMWGLPVSIVLAAKH